MLCLHSLIPDSSGESWGQWKWSGAQEWLCKDISVKRLSALTFFKYIEIKERNPVVWPLQYLPWALNLRPTYILLWLYSHSVHKNVGSDELVHIHQRQLEWSTAVFRKEETLIAVIPTIYGICFFGFIIGSCVFKFVSCCSDLSLSIPHHEFMNMIFFVEVVNSIGYSLPWWCLVEFCSFIV
jgi:hypothetical protein